MRKGWDIVAGIMLVAVAAPLVWFSQQSEASEQAVVNAPRVTYEVVYSTTEPTQDPVLVTLKPSETVTPIKPATSLQKQFSENGAFVFVFEDTYGRRYEEAVKVDNIDREPPAVELQTEADLTRADEVQVLVRGQEIDRYRYRLNGGEWQTVVEAGQPIVLADLALGEYRLEVLAADKAGNWTAEETPTELTWVHGMFNSAGEIVKPRETPISRGQKAIEVSIGEQHMWVYDGEVMVLETPITTGANGMNTRRGEFSISQMHEDKHFDGGYFSDYWMRFDGGIGIHDATWRVNFGSQDYKWTGSHGCVNTPFEVAKTLYSWAEVGTSVVVF